jgi:hypothetical protein
MHRLSVPAMTGIILVAACALGLGSDSAGHRSSHSVPGHIGHESPMRHGSSHSGLFEIIYPMVLEPRLRSLSSGPEPGPPPNLILGPPAGEPAEATSEHFLPRDLHHHAHGAARASGETAANSPPPAREGTGSDEARGATAQPDPSASPWTPRPPGASGPGRRVAGSSGPGMPGPGRPVVSRW